MAKSGEKWKKSGQEWLGVALCGYLWFYVAKSGFSKMWLIVAKSMYYLKDNT